MRFRSLTSSVLAFALAGCPSSVDECPGDGRYVEAGGGRYCAYAGVSGGFGCPAGMPHRIDFESRDSSVPDGALCSDRPVSSREQIPEAACLHIPACVRTEADAAFETVDAASMVDAALGSGLDAGPELAPDAPCPDGFGSCEGLCVDVLNSHRFCGADRGCTTFDRCEGHERCIDGSCVAECEPGLLDCAGACVDPRTDPSHCGAGPECVGGEVCGDGLVCRGGDCVAP